MQYTLAKDDKDFLDDSTAEGVSSRTTDAGGADTDVNRVLSKSLSIDTRPLPWSLLFPSSRNEASAPTTPNFYSTTGQVFETPIHRSTAAVQDQSQITANRSFPGSWIDMNISPGKSPGKRIDFDDAMVAFERNGIGAILRQCQAHEEGLRSLHLRTQ